MERKALWHAPEVLKSYSEEELNQLIDNQELLARGGSAEFINCTSIVRNGMFVSDRCL